MKTLAKYSNFLNWFGVSVAIVSCALMASHTHYSAYAWVGYALSSVLLLGWAISVKHYAQILLNLAFLIANLVGVLRWLL